MKPKILLVVDEFGWALDNISKELKKNLSEFYEIDIVSIKMFKNNIVKVFILGKKYNLIHFFWRDNIFWIKLDGAKSYIKKMGIEYDEFVKKYLKQNIITTSVYDHMFLENENIEKTKFILDTSNKYTVSSKKLFEIYKNIENLKKPNCIIQDGVDLDVFKPFDIERFKKIGNKEINIGWVGNSKFVDSENDNDLKGVRKIIIPALNELKEEGYNIKKEFADKNDRLIPHDKMPEYYNGIDLYVCASKTEGTPNPVLESMACGIPIITTDVGIVSEVFGEKQKKFILEERTKECLKNKIKELLKNKELFYELSNENLKQIKEWSWKKISQKYKKFFDENLNDVGVK